MPERRFATEDTEITEEEWRGDAEKWTSPPCLFVSRGNKGVKGEVASGRWLVASRRRADERVGLVVGVPDGIPGRAEMIQEQRPRSITGEA